MMNQRDHRHVVGPDDLSVGVEVTVHRGRLLYVGTNQYGGPVYQEWYADLKGAPLVVTGVSPPYVLTKSLIDDKPHPIDLRKGQLCRVDPRYVKATIEAYRPKPPAEPAVPVAKSATPEPAGSGVEVVQPSSTGGGT